MCTHHDDEHDDWTRDLANLPKPTPVHDTDPDEDAEDDLAFALTFTRFR